MKRKEEEEEENRENKPKPNVKERKKKTTCVGESKRSNHGSQVCLFIYQNAMKTQFA